MVIAVAEANTTSSRKILVMLAPINELLIDKNSSPTCNETRLTRNCERQSQALIIKIYISSEV